MFGYTYARLGDIGSFTHGGGPQKKDFQQTPGFGCIHYGQIYTVYGISTVKTKTFVSHHVASKSRKALPGDLIIADTSENDEDLAKAVAWLGNEEIAVSNHTLIFRSETVLAKFLSYYIQTDTFQQQKRKCITGTKVRTISAANMSHIVVPVPPLAEQERIVSILDKFDALVTDLSSGLPAEIEARQKQYEYYRDKLLDFRITE